jgi:hypothetical protein
MRIDGTNRGANVSKKTGARRSSAGGAKFSVGSEEATPAATNSAGASATTGIDAILALQAVEDPLFAKRKAIKRASSILEALEAMKADLLAGRISESQLNRLMALLQQAKVDSEPGLDAVIADIELRARVELAKLGRFPKG